MPIKVVIDNAYSHITGLTSSQLSGLRKVLSYTKNPESAFFQGGFIRKTYMIDKRGSFPTGLIGRVANWLSETSLKYVLDDRRKAPATNRDLFSLQAFTPYLWQTEASARAYILSRGGIVAPTGTGKSAAIAMIINELQVPTLIIVPTLEIKKQLMADIKNLLGSLEYIRVENIDSNALEADLKVDCLILDECHHAAAKTYHKLNKRYWKGIYYRFFLSATFFRNNANETFPFEAICGSQIYQLTYQRAVSEGYIVPVEAYYVDLPKVHTEAYTWQEVYKELVTRNVSRNLIICDIMRDLNDSHKSTLCLVKEVSHGNELASLTGFPFANGQDEESRKYIDQFKRGEIKILIGTEGILGEGIDTKPAEYVIIAGLGKAKSAFMQKVGRVVRRYPGKESGKVIFFRDPSHKFCLTHWKAQCKVLKEEYNVLPTKL